ncbi:hypothetical protein UFOVP273_45 [uncultured Caudovirales phage]|uniref:Uncharacterized protein n=1 Tax=uncultured Caudovirales phage TaxID=2100421 RepID=A0A6J5LLE6_9CAUD|nr:hypothetical protein UFOVP273_45 [uncultured Caudovirales phage]
MTLLEMVAKHHLSVTHSKFLAMVTTKDGVSFWAYFAKPNKNAELEELVPEDQVAIVALQKCYDYMEKNNLL